MRLEMEIRIQKSSSSLKRKGYIAFFCEFSAKSKLFGVRKHTALGSQSEISLDFSEMRELRCEHLSA